MDRKVFITTIVLGILGAVAVALVVGYLMNKDGAADLESSSGLGDTSSEVDGSVLEMESAPGGPVFSGAPQVVSFSTTRAAGGSSEDIVFSWESKNTEYCTISGEGFFSGEERFSPTGSVQKKLRGFSEGQFNIYCYNLAGGFDANWVAVTIGGN